MESIRAIPCVGALQLASFKELYDPPDHKEGGHYGAKNWDQGCWDCIAWSPDGTKLMLVTQVHASALVVLEFVPSMVAKPAAPQFTWQGMSTKIQNFFFG